jgi:hypothetical protein
MLSTRFFHRTRHFARACSPWRSPSLAACTHCPEPAGRSACRAPPSISNAPVRVALLVPLGSGDPGREQIGRSLVNAAQLAQADLQGVEHRPARLRDRRQHPAAAPAPRSSAVAEGAQIMLGPLFSAPPPPAAEADRQRSAGVLADQLLPTTPRWRAAIDLHPRRHLWQRRRARRLATPCRGASPTSPSSTPTASRARRPAPGGGGSGPPPGRQPSSPSRVTTSPCRASTAPHPPSPTTCAPGGPAPTPWCSTDGPDRRPRPDRRRSARPAASERTARPVPRHPALERLGRGPDPDEPAGQLVRRPRPGHPRHLRGSLPAPPTASAHTRSRGSPTTAWPWSAP